VTASGSVHSLVLITHFRISNLDEMLEGSLIGLQMIKLGGIGNVLHGRIRSPKDLDRLKQFELK
jgi:hypothetical protein